MTIRKLLFATKFDALNLEVLKSLLDLKPAGLEEILLTHIIPRDEVAFVPFGGYLKDEEQRLRGYRDFLGKARIEAEPL